MAFKTFIESRVEMEQILREENLGYLGLSVRAMPYVVPLNFVYIEGKILFHCALTGKKLEVMRANPQVCFTVSRQAGQVVRHPQDTICHPENDSVICYGVARIIEDLEERLQALNTFNHSLQPGSDEITREDAAKCYAVEITISEMTGRQEHAVRGTGSDPVYWHYRFPPAGGFKM